MNKNWWSSLRIKIIGWSFIPTVIILSAVAWFTFYSYQIVLGNLAIKQYPEIIQPKAQAFYQAFAKLNNVTTVAIILNVDTDHGLPLEARAQKILDNAPNLENYDGGIYFLDRQGKVFRTQPEFPELIGQDWSDTPPFRAIHEKPNASATSNLMALLPSGEKVICAVTALSGDVWTDVAGAIYCCFTVNPAKQNAYYEAIQSLDLGANVYVVDGNQQIVYSPDLAKMGKDLSGEAYMQQLSQGENRSGRFSIGSQDMIVSYIPVAPVPKDQWDWHIVSEVSWSEIMQPSRPYQRLLLVLLALGVVAPVLVTTYGVRHITEPIQQLIHAARQVTAGEFKQRIEVKTGDEIETLAEQFNLMSAELDEYYSSLEKKVADRTRELAILNTIISVASHSLDIHEVLEDALSKTVEQMSFDAGLAFKFTPGSPEPVLIAQHGFEPAVALEHVNWYTLIRQPLQADLNEVTLLRIEDFQDEKLKEYLSSLGFQLLVYTPLSTKGRELGFFILARCTSGELSPEERSLLSSTGKGIGVAIENANLYEQAEQTGITEERSRLARELHDAVTQTLFSANLIADVLPRIWKRDPQEGMQNLEELRQLTRGALAEMRTLLLEMRPSSLERADLRSLLTQLTEAFIGRVRVPVSLDIQGECQLALEVKLVVYRVAQEALNNIAKHSGARQVELHMVCQPGRLTLCIQDDGLGFDVAAIPPNHLGIAIMRERASSIGASLKIQSQVGQGTKVELDWELAGKEG